MGKLRLTVFELYGKCVKKLEQFFLLVNLFKQR